MRLDPENLQVTSFQTVKSQLPGGYCCTGCDSGCGIFPTNSGCESGGQTFDDFACGVVIKQDVA